jgi:hypothetical protein
MIGGIAERPEAGDQVFEVVRPAQSREPPFLNSVLNPDGIRGAVRSAFRAARGAAERAIAARSAFLTRLRRSGSSPYAVSSLRAGWSACLIISKIFAKRLKSVAETRAWNYPAQLAYSAVSSAATEVAC